VETEEDKGSGMNVVAHNLSSMFTNRELGIVNDRKAKSSEKLSSGYRINRAADDAAGLSISEKMRRQIRGLNQGSDNLQDGVSFCQTADGYLEEVVAMLHRMNELSIKAANGTNSASDRMDIDNEIQELKEETNRIFKSARFNEVHIFEVPYVPAPEIHKDSTAMEIQVFSNGLDASGNVMYGGIEYYNVRHTWDELGIEISDDGKTFAKNQVVDLSDIYAGTEGGSTVTERLELIVSAGDSLSRVARRNHWSADETGLYINNRLAGTWDEIGITDGANFGEYSVEYNQQTVWFEVNDGDDKTAVIDGINGKLFNTEYTWDIYTKDDAYIDSGKALDITDVNTIRVTDGNKDSLENSFRLQVYGDGISDDSGIKLTMNGSDLTKMNWSSIIQTSPSSPSYPISDWGLSNKDESLVTFDDSATYKYINSDGTDLGIEVTFNLADEAGFDEIRKAINGDSDGKDLSKTFTAPIKYNNDVSASVSAGRVAPSVSFSASSALLAGGYASYEIQRSVGRSFDDANDTLSGTVTRTLNDVGLKDTAVGTGSKNTYVNVVDSPTVEEVYVKGDDDKYYLNEKTTTKQEKISNWSVTTRETYEAYYTYEGNFKNATLDNVTGNNFEYYKYTTRQMQQITDETLYSYSSLGGEGKSYDELIAEGVDPSKLQEKQSDISVDRAAEQVGSEVKSILSRADDTIQLKSGGDLIGSLTIKDSGQRRSEASSELGSSTVNFSFQTTDYAYCDFNAEENESSAGNINNHIKLENLTINRPPKQLPIQVSAKNPDHINLEWSGLNNAIIGIKGTTTDTIEHARYAIDEIGDAIKIVSDTRSIFGAQQNRLEHSIKINDNTSENTQAAESKIRDTDMAAEMVRYSRENILQQAGQAMLAQAQRQPESVINLLG